MESSLRFRLRYELVFETPRYFCRDCPLCAASEWKSSWRSYLSAMTKTTFQKLYLFATLIVIACSACKRENEPPILRLNGATSIEILRGTAVKLPTAIAFDKEDFDLTSEIVVTGTYDKNRVGYYPITYTVTDHDGSTAEATVTVHVYHGSNNLGGTFRSSNDCGNSCPSSGQATIGFEGVSYRIRIEPAFGTSGSASDVLRFDYNRDGELTFISAQFPCNYTLVAASGRISPAADTISIELKLSDLFTGVGTDCRLMYVRQ
jgi:hypothetical protein